jgi:CRISP-associated protein Cas1
MGDLMSALYLIEQNTVLRKSGDRLLLCRKPPKARNSPGVRETDIAAEWPCADVDHVMVFGNVQITTQAMQHLLESGIETAIFTLHGRLLGQLTPPGGKNIFLRQKQYEKSGDEAFALELSKSIVRKKIQDGLEILREFHKNHPESFLSGELDGFETACRKLDEVSNLDSLRGYEGSASALYFKLLGRIPPPEWRFSVRSRLPPKDPANAVLSFGYTIAASELGSILDGVGFDPYLGFYHQIQYGRPSLALDLVEMFRHSMIDRLMLKLFDLGVLDQTDFETVAKGGVYLSAGGKKKFFLHYEKLAGKYRGDTPGEEPGGSFRRMFQDQAAALAATVKDDKPFVICV